MANKSTYPQNLLEAIFRCELSEAKTIYAEAFGSTLLDDAPDFGETLDTILKSDFSTREQALIRLRFVCGLTLRALGAHNDVNLSPERVRQILEKCLRKLRHPLRSRRLILGDADFAIWQKKQEELRIKEDTARRESYKQKDGLQNFLILDTTLNFRIIHALSRYGLTSLQDVVNLGLSELAKIPNLGVSSLNCLAQYIKDNFGVDLT